MIDHVSIGVSDIARARRFYDAALRPLGYTCQYEDHATLGYGATQIQFWVYGGKRPVEPDTASGLHFCFAAPTRASVDAFHRAAVAEHGRDNGSPGLRADYGDNYYAAYVVDPDGYRIEACCAAAA